MNRYYPDEYEDTDGCLVNGTMIEHSDGAYVLYEEARLIEVDRDIKAANLQLLVEKVLAIDVDSDKGTWDAIEAALDLARSLKQ